MNKQYELAVLSCLLLDEGQEYLSPQEVDSSLFSVEILPIVDKIKDFRAQGKQYDVILLQSLLGKENLNQIRELVEATGTCVLQNAKHYLYELKMAKFEKWMYSSLESGQRPNHEELKQQIDLLAKDEEKSNVHVFDKSILKYIDDLYQNIDVEHYTTDINEIDLFLGRIEPGEFITIGGTTGLGKTNFALRLLGNFILKDIPCLYLSSEMGFTALFNRMVAQNSDNLSAFKIRNRSLTNEEKEEVKRVCEKFYTKKSLIQVSGKFSIQNIVKLIKEFKSKIIFVDYVQMFRLDVPRGHNVASANAELAKAVKDICLEYGVIMFGLSQVNSAGELRESRAWEDKSDVVIKLSGDPEKDFEFNSSKDIKCTIHKNRFGTPGIIDMVMNKTTLNVTVKDKLL